MIVAMDETPKSSYELAMERLRKKDAEEGVSERAVSEEQKQEIAEVRKTYGAKLAQEEILFKSKMQALMDFDSRRALEDNYRRDVERLNHERDRKIEKIRSS
jgi:Mg-chelatase subunit ChlI